MPSRAAEQALDAGQAKRQKLENKQSMDPLSQLHDGDDDSSEGSADLGEGPDSPSEDVHSLFRDADALFAPEHLSSLYDAFTGRGERAASSLASETAVVERKPFPSLQLRNVFSEEFIQSAQKQLIETVTYTQKGNDLYSYRGSGDLSDDSVCPDGSPLAKLRDALYSDSFTRFISAATGVKLFPNRPDLSSHQYWNGDHLLAHDDDVRGEMAMENEGRRIAFILYLVDEKWSKDDGGSLDLFQCDTLGHPTTVTKSIYPAFNSIALFEVTPTSYHTVAEVTLEEPSSRGPPYRLSISGWFHGPLTNRLSQPLDVPAFLPLKKAAPSAEALINETYLDEETHSRIQASLISDSSIELRSFLKASVWEQLQSEIASTSFDTSLSSVVGPAHLRHFYSLSSTPTLDAVLAFLRSAEFLALLSAFTSLEFGPSETRGRVQGRLFKQGSYTLLHDQGHDPDGVDIVLGLGTKKLPSMRPAVAKSGKAKGKGKAKSADQAVAADGEDDFAENGWKKEWGGVVCYMPNRMGASPSPEPEPMGGENKDELNEEDDDDGALYLSSKPNTLAVIVRNINTLKFVKYVNNSAKDPIDGSPLARLDIEGLYAVDIGGDDGESVEGEIVADESDEEEKQEGDELEEDEPEWTGFGDRSAKVMADDGIDELDDD